MGGGGGGGVGIQGAIVRRAIVWGGGDCLGGLLSWGAKIRGQLSGGQLSGGGNCLGSKCPDTGYIERRFCSLTLFVY